MKLKIGNVTLENNLVLAPIGRGDRPSFPAAVQGAGSRTDLYGDGKR